MNIDSHFSSHFSEEKKTEKFREIFWEYWKLIKFFLEHRFSSTFCKRLVAANFFTLYQGQLRNRLAGINKFA